MAGTQVYFGSRGCGGGLGVVVINGGKAKLSFRQVGYGCD